MIKYKLVSRIFITLWLGCLIFFVAFIFINRETTQPKLNNKYIIVVVPPYSTPTVTYKSILNKETSKDTLKRY